MNTPALSPLKAAVLVSLLQPTVDRFDAYAKQHGFARLDMGLLKDPSNKQSREVTDDPLLNIFRAVAEELNPAAVAMKVPDLIAFIQAALPSLKLPTVTYRFFEARPGNPRINRETGEEYTPMLKATTASYFGTPKSTLSPEAQAAAARAKARVRAALSGATVTETAAPEAIVTDEIPY